MSGPVGRTEKAPAPRVTILCGPAGAGKTTLARRLEADGALRLSMDLAVWEDGWRGQWPPHERMLELDAVLQYRLADTVRAGRDVVVDMSASVREVRDVWRDLAVRCGAEHRLIVVTADRRTLVRRVAAREGQEGPDVVHLEEVRLLAYIEGFGWPGPDEPHTLVDTSERG